MTNFSRSLKGAEVLDEDENTHHVYPIFGRDHVTDRGAACWCGPRTEYVEGGKIIIHEAEQ